MEEKSPLQRHLHVAAQEHEFKVLTEENVFAEKTIPFQKKSILVVIQYPKKNFDPWPQKELGT